MSGVSAAPELSHDLLRRHALAHDASHFLVIPEAVCTVSSTSDIVAVFDMASSRGLPVTFRSGGTSLSGQASGSGLLVDSRRGFNAMEILDGGRRVRVEPGVALRLINGRLARLGYQMGPDPASEIACTIGGVLANNSSGMACGVTDNSYQTLASATIVLPSGTIINTADTGSDQQLRDTEPHLYSTLVELRDRIRANDDSVATISRLFSLKNTMGYSLNAFLDCDRPVDILLRLMVGSEGTLGFVSEAVFHTVALKPHALTGLLVFDSLARATQALESVVSSGAAVAELLDETSLRVARMNPDVHAILPDTQHPGEAALLVEYRVSTADELPHLRQVSDTLIADVCPLAPSAFSDDPELRNALWTVRKGLFASVAAGRKAGELSLLEDIAVPMDKLLDTVTHLQELFSRYHYPDAVIFGHAKDGNIHFLLNQSFATDEDVARFDHFTEELVELVLGMGGTLKAEHGTGRMMAGFVERQYGSELYEVMVALKRACDPQGLLNPGVIIATTPDAHLRDLKTVPEIAPQANSCVECGYCELVCPSKDLTLTPRQRIVIQRDIAHAHSVGNVAVARELNKSFRYDGIDTCAVDGMCETVCPVGIDTGSLVKHLRATTRSALREKLWAMAARHWRVALVLISRSLTIATLLPHRLVTASTRLLRTLFGSWDIPLWTPDLPRGGTTRVAATSAEPVDLVFLPSCTGSMFGHGESLGSDQAFRQLCDRAGIRYQTPSGISGLCCGTPWTSKGLEAGWDAMHKVAATMVSEGGVAGARWVTDSSSCQEGFSTLLASRGVEVVDVVSVVETLLDRLTVSQPLNRLVIHPTCSTHKTGNTPQLHQIAQRIANEVVVPESWGCCGFAGDRGMLYPELTASATAQMATELAGCVADGYASTNRTCEIAMTRATGKQYRHIVEWVEHVTRPLPTEPSL